MLWSTKASQPLKPCPEVTPDTFGFLEGAHSTAWCYKASNVQNGSFWGRKCIFFGSKINVLDTFSAGFWPFLTVAETPSEVPLILVRGQQNLAGNLAPKKWHGEPTDPVPDWDYGQTTVFAFGRKVKKRAESPFFAIATIQNWLKDWYLFWKRVLFPFDNLARSWSRAGSSGPCAINDAMNSLKNGWFDKLHKTIKDGGTAPWLIWNDLSTWPYGKIWTKRKERIKDWTIGMGRMVECFLFLLQAFAPSALRLDVY